MRRAPSSAAASVAPPRRALRSGAPWTSHSRSPNAVFSSGGWPSFPPENFLDVPVDLARPRTTTRCEAMKYLCLVYLEQDKLHAVPDRECADCGAGFRQSGLLVAAEALQPVDTATTVRVRSGMVSITDGPFAETKEQLAGFYLIDAADLNEALQVAAKIPPAREGSVEVRPVRELQP